MKTGNDVTSINDLNQDNSFHVKRAFEVSISNGVEASEPQTQAVAKAMANAMVDALAEVGEVDIETKAEANIGLAKRAFEASVTNDLKVDGALATTEVITEVATATVLDRDPAAVGAVGVEHVNALGNNVDVQLQEGTNIRLVKRDLGSAAAQAISQAAGSGQAQAVAQAVAQAAIDSNSGQTAAAAQLQAGANIGFIKRDFMILKADRIKAEVITQATNLGNQALDLAAPLDEATQRAISGRIAAYANQKGVEVSIKFKGELIPGDVNPTITLDAPAALAYALGQQVIDLAATVNVDVRRAISGNIVAHANQYGIPVAFEVPLLTARAKQDISTEVNPRLGLTPAATVPLMLTPPIVPQFATKARDLLEIAGRKIAELAPASTLEKNVPKALAATASASDAVSEASSSLLQAAWDSVRQHPYYFLAATAGVTALTAGTCYYFQQKRQASRKESTTPGFTEVRVDKIKSALFV